VRENSGIALGVGGAIVAFLALLAFLIVVSAFGFLFVYAIVKAFGPSTAHASATTVLVGVVLIVSALALALCGGLALIGRAMTPRRRDAARA
jgi:hypothetical protein